MEQYPIPQFIEQEGRIAFFISFRQFFYLVGAGAVCFILYYTLPFALFVVAGTIIMGAAAALAFITVNGDPLLNILMASVGFMFRGKNYVWSKKESPYPFKPIKMAHIKKISDEPLLQTQSSQLKRIKTQIETKAK